MTPEQLPNTITFTEEALVAHLSISAFFGAWSSWDLFSRRYEIPPALNFEYRQQLAVIGRIILDKYGPPSSPECVEAMRDLGLLDTGRDA